MVTDLWLPRRQDPSNVSQLVMADGRPAAGSGMLMDETTRACAAAVLYGAWLALGRTRLEVHGHEREGLTVAQLADLWRDGNLSGTLGTAFELTVQRSFLAPGPDGEVLRAALAEIGFGEVRVPEAFVLGGEKSGTPLFEEASRVIKQNGEGRVWAPNATERFTLSLESLGRLIMAHRHKSGVVDGQPLLPAAFSGLWKADVFLGDISRGQWVGVSCKARRKDKTIGDPAVGVPLVVVPDPPSRGTTGVRILRGRPSIGLPQAGIYSTLTPVKDTVVKWLSFDGRLPSADASIIAPELSTVLKELTARLGDPVADVVEEWLNLTGTRLRRNITSRRPFAVAA